MIELSRWHEEGVTLTVGVAQTDQEFTDISRLRYRTYVENLREIPESEVPEPYRRRREEWDQHDATAIHLIQTLEVPGREPEVIGTLRFMRCDHSFALGQPGVTFSGVPFALPAQHPDYPSIPINPAETAEASRWISRLVDVPSGHRLQASMQLFSCGLEALRRDGRRWWINALRTKKWSFIRHDWPFVEFGPPGPHLYHGAEVVVCLLRVPSDAAGDYPWSRHVAHQLRDQPRSFEGIVARQG